MGVQILSKFYPDFSVGDSTADVTIEGTIEGGDSVSYIFSGDTDNQLLEPGFNITTFGPFSSPELRILGDRQVPADPLGSMTISVSMVGDGASGNEINGAFTGAITLVPSQANVTVPDVVGDAQSAAEAEIEAAGLQVGTITSQESADVAAGNVISQSPEGGASAAPGSPVNLVISAGAAPPDVPQPFGLSGLWFDPAFDGEGYNVIVFEGGMIVYYYGHDARGERLWLISETYTGAIRQGESVTVTMFKGAGTFADPNPSLQEWGTLNITFDNCTAGRVSMTGDDGTKNANIVLLVQVGDLDCGA